MNYDVNNSTFWNDKYINDEHGWDLGQVTPTFIDKEKTLQKQSQILMPGCGLGHDAIYLAKKKHNVDALDFSEYAIDFISRTAKEKKININPINDNFFNLSNQYNNKYDYIIEYTFFCAILPNKRLLYATKCSDLLKKNGELLGLFLPLNAESCTNPPYQVTIDSIINNFSQLFNLIEIDYKINSITKRLGNEVFVRMIKK